MNEKILLTIIFLFCFFLVLLNSIIIYFTFKLYKFNPNQRDFFIYKKYFFLFIFAIISIIFKIYENEKIIKKIYLKYFSNYFYCFLTFFNFFIIKEEYFLIKNPFYNFINIFDKKFKYYKKEFFIAIFIMILIIINEIFNIKFNINFNFYLENILTLITSFIINIINLIYITKTIFFINKIQNTSKKKIQIILTLNFILILYNFIYNLIIITLIITSTLKINFFLLNKKILFEILFSFSFYFDTFIQILCIKNTDFFYYFFAEEDFSFLFKFFCLFNNYYKRPLFNISSFLSSNESSISENEEEFKQRNFNDNLIKNDKNIEKEQILLNFILKMKFNSIFSLNFEICEYFLNLSLISIYKIFKKIIYEKQTQNDISTFNNENNLNEIFINDLNNNKNIKKNFLIFNYNFNSFNDFEYKNIFLLYKNFTFDNKNFNNDFNINIKYLFYDEFEKIINDFNINLEEIIESLISHQNFPFLIAKNSKEEEFQFLNNFQLKSNDFKIIIYIYNNIFEEKTNNKKINDYFNYLNLNKNSFLPKIFAIFNIKINNFNSFTLILGKNPIFDNIPKQNFNYWQIMKFNKIRNDFYKIITSKDRNSICIFEDNLLNGINKLFIKDYENFKLLLENDLNFLKNLNSKNFEFYLIYYEIDQNNNNNNNNNEENLKISQNSNFLFLNRLSNLSNIRNSIINQNRNTKFSINFRTSEINNISLQNIENNFFDNNDNNNNNNNESIFLNDEIIENLDTNIKINPKKIINNQEGFECLFNEYKCLIFCTFENIFDFNNNNNINNRNINNFYLNFKNNLLNNFEQKKN